MSQLVAVSSAHAAAMRALFAQVFGHEMDQAHWDWKYGGGRGCAVAVEDGDGRFVAHYGGTTRELAYLGRRERGCQVCDVMVDPQANRSLTRHGPLAQAASQFLRTQIGRGRPHLVGFGFPNRRAFGVFERLGYYAGVDEVVQLKWPADAAAAPPGRLQALDAAALASADTRRRADVLWAAMGADLREAIVGVRDAAWLQRRYLDRPGVAYALTLVCSRWWRRPLGIAVTRLRDDAVELLDVVAGVRHFGALVRVAQLQAAAAGRAVATAWVTRSQLTHFAAAGSQPPSVDELGVTVPTSIHTEGPPPDEVKGRWFLMGGDADFT